jgi:hypothetical protein
MENFREERCFASKAVLLKALVSFKTIRFPPAGVEGALGFPHHLLVRVRFSCHCGIVQMAMATLHSIIVP